MCTSCGVGWPVGDSQNHKLPVTRAGIACMLGDGIGIFFLLHSKLHCGPVATRLRKLLNTDLLACLLD